jgi:hypothetical protein
MKANDRADIETLLYLYAHLMDSGRNDLVASQLFAENAIVDAGIGEPAVGRDAIHEFYTSSLIPTVGRNAKGVCHLLTNPLIEIDGDRARSNVRVLCYMWALDTGGNHSPVADSVLIGAYQDEHRRTAEGWRIASRRVCTFGTSVAGGSSPTYIKAIVEGVKSRAPDWPWL